MASHSGKSSMGTKLAACVHTVATLKTRAAPDHTSPAFLPKVVRDDEWLMANKSSPPRHGWGCQPDQAGAVRHLTAAASNAASVEQLALQAGLKKGGAAKGELVLAIFELANCFRHGWGIDKDPIAAKQVSYRPLRARGGDCANMMGLKVL